MTAVDRALSREATAAKALLTSIAPVIGDDEIARADAIEGETDLLPALDAALARLVELQAHADGIDALIARLKARERRLQEQVERIRDAIIAALDGTGQRKIERPVATITLKTAAPAVVITAEAELPSEYLVETVALKPDRKSILAALTAGATVPGAALKNGAPSLVIRWS